MPNTINLSDYTKSIIEKQKQKQNTTNNNTRQPQTQESKDTVEISTKATEEKTDPKNEIDKPQTQESKDTVEISTKFNEAKNQNGLIEKAADFIKGKTGLGFSSKKIQEKINQNQDKETILKDIKKYKRQQENIAQTIVDTLTCAAILFSFAKSKKLSLLQTFKNKISGNNLFANRGNQTISLICGLGAAYIGAIIKTVLLSLNRIGTSQYKVKKDEKTDKNQYRVLKQATRKDKVNANLRNGASGAINGILATLIPLGGGFVGAPLYVILNSLNRYFIASKEDSSEKSIKSYIENLKNSPLSNGISAAVILAIAAKKGINLSKYQKNIQTAFNKINENGILNVYNDGKTTYEKLADVLINNSDARTILDSSPYKSADELYNTLSENTFFLKVLQIQENRSGNDALSIFAKLLGQSEYSDSLGELINKLKTDGPRTYSAQEAGEIIKKAFNGKYTLVGENPLGVGTVAETYLVKDQSGKELVVKLLKKGIDPNGGKIAQDAEKCREIIQKATNLSESEKTMLLSSFNDIAEGVIKEANLAHEMEAAKKLAESTTLAKVVKGIEVSEDGTAYVMEKANGECLQKVSDYIKRRKSLEKEIQRLTKNINSINISGNQETSWHKDALEKAQQELKELIESNKGMEGFAGLTNDESMAMLELYQDILVEQFNKVSPKGKTIHADIHPGNIMIDINALKAYVAGDKTARKKVFTLIDTGNTIEQTPEVALRFLNFSRYIEDADVDNIVSFALEGAKLPSGKIYSRTAEAGEEIASKEEMDKYFKIIKEKLAGEDGKSGIFFDGKTALGKITNESMIEGITNKALQEEGIVPSNLQGNLIKAQTSARNSLKQFKKNNTGTLLSNLSETSKMSSVKGFFRTIKNSSNYRAKQKKQERKNLRKLAPSLKIKMKKSKTAPSKDSVEYLTYLLKQDKVNQKTEDNMEFLEDLFDAYL